MFWISESYIPPTTVSLQVSVHTLSALSTPSPLKFQIRMDLLGPSVCSTRWPTCKSSFISWQTRWFKYNHLSLVSLYSCGGPARERECVWSSGDDIRTFWWSMGRVVGNHPTTECWVTAIPKNLVLWALLKTTGEGLWKGYKSDRSALGDVRW